MFRRPGKGPLDKESSSPLYKEEPPLATPYKYGVKKGDLPSSEPLPRIYEAPPHLSEERMFMEDNWTSEKPAAIPHPLSALRQEETPETTLGEGVSFRGELCFERLLRIDGTFEGELLSQGKVIVGPTGKVKANLNLREAIIEGEVKGNITVQERLELRGEAIVQGDIQAKLLSVDEGVTIIGNVRVTPRDNTMAPPV